MSTKNVRKNLVVKSALRVLKVADLQVDPSYQRDIKKKHTIIVAEFNEESFDIPVVAEREDGTLWIVDGLQRITALRRMERKEVRAEVFASEGPEHEAKVFKDINLNRSKLSPTEEFRSLLTSGDRTCWQVKEAVEKLGYRIVLGRSGKGDANDVKAMQLTCTNTLLKIAKETGGIPAIDFCLRTVKECWPGDVLGSTSKLLHGLAIWFYRYEGVVDEERLCNRLKKVTPHKIIYTANQSLGGSGGGSGISYSIADVIERTYRKRAK